MEAVSGSQRELRDGLIAAYKDRKVRVRIAGGDIAMIAIKGPRIGIAQAEFEYEIPIADAEKMLSTMCQDDTLEKERQAIQSWNGRGCLVVNMEPQPLGRVFNASAKTIHGIRVEMKMSR